MGKVIFTCGYGNRTPDEFVKLLKDAGITAVLDVRRKGSKSWCAKYNQGFNMKWLLENRDVKYWSWEAFGNHYDTLAAYRVWLDGPLVEEEMCLFAGILEDDYLEDVLCLICAEGNPFEGHGAVGGVPVVRCHRVYVAAALVRELGDGWTIFHL